MSDLQTKSKEGDQGDDYEPQKSVTVNRCIIGFEKSCGTANL